MDADEQEIRGLVRTWLTASADGDVDQVLALLSDDVVFLTPGRQPFGKELFAAALRASRGKARAEARADVQEVQVSGDLAFCRVHLTVTLRTPDGAELKRLSGPSMSVLRKHDGRWAVVRDANFVAPERMAFSAVPVLQVANVASSAVWYRDTLGFTASPAGPPDGPVFAILQRDGVEIMLQKARGPVQRREASELSMDVYLRVADVQAFRASVVARVPDVGPIVEREYGCREFRVAGPDGHVIVVSQRV